MRDSAEDLRCIGSWVQGLEFRARGLGFRVPGSGLRDRLEGLGFRVSCRKGWTLDEHARNSA